MIYMESGFGRYIEGAVGTLRASGGNNGGGSETLIIKDYTAYGVNEAQNGATNLSRELHACLTCGGGKPGQSYPCVLVDRGGSDAMENQPIALHITQNPITSDTVTPCISSGNPNTGQATVGVSVDYTVRRLTPLECECLQGFPDNWTDIGEWGGENGKLRKESADSARYKAIGNSIALPPWVYVLQRLTLCAGSDTTMASLFDGMGGFPLIWERLNGKGSCLWASEIEEFPIAVTKRRFSEVPYEK